MKVKFEDVILPTCNEEINGHMLQKIIQVENKGDEIDVIRKYIRILCDLEPGIEKYIDIDTIKYIWPKISFILTDTHKFDKDKRDEFSILFLYYY